MASKTKYDIVYILKKDCPSEELRYSLRSLKNFPHNRVIFYGGCPEGFRPDLWIEYEQRGKTGASKVTDTLNQIAKDERIPEDFWLFNDDFFIVKPYKLTTATISGTLEKRYIQNNHRYGFSTYARVLYNAYTQLKKRGLDTLSYEGHTPMLFNKTKLAKVLDEFGAEIMFRSIYGNYYKIPAVLRGDCKIKSLTREPDKDADLLSTWETSFADGKVGEYIRAKFPTPCKYEEENDGNTL